MPSPEPHSGDTAREWVRSALAEPAPRPEDLPVALKALDAVLQVHQPRLLTGRDTFRRLLAHQWPVTGQVCARDVEQAYPCTTVRAIAAALEDQD